MFPVIIDFLIYLPRTDSNVFMFTILGTLDFIQIYIVDAIGGKLWETYIVLLTQCLVFFLINQLLKKTTHLSQLC